MSTGSESTDGEVVLRGVLSRVTFRNAESGYCVLQIAVPEESGRVTVVGRSIAVEAGQHLIARGRFIQHQKFGRQFSATSITPTNPSSNEGIERFLSSGIIKGIGDTTAQRIVTELGAQAIEIICKDPDRVAKVKGVGKNRAKLLHDALAKKQAAMETVRYLVEHRLTPNMAQRVMERYQDRTIEVMKNDPYVLARDLRGVGFITADTIAINMGLAPDSPQRLKAGLYHSLEKALDDGHIYLPQRVLIDRTTALLQIDGHLDLSEQLEELIREGYLLREGEDRIYLKHMQRAERFVAEFIAARAHPLDHPKIGEQQVIAALEAASSDLGITFSAEQRQAVIDASRYKLLLITGGPGCGKTTVIRALTKLFQSSRQRLLLAAPTGRAAQRMSQLCGVDARTIHRMLKYDPLSGKFVHNISDPLPVDAVIIDETSMLDLTLAKDLFSAIPAEATLILVGDKDQLPSVGPGRVFGDLISMRELRVASLSRLYRRGSESSINEIAHSINSGITPNIPEPDNGKTLTDAYFIVRNDAVSAADTVERLVSEIIPRRFGFALDDIAVLTPSNRGPLGTIALNQRLQGAVNPSVDSEQELLVGEQIFRLNDRVCQRVNNYKIDPHGVFNGDGGRIHQVMRSSNSLHVELWDGRLIKYSPSELAQISLAYAITVHRSQGSEYPCVVLALHDSQFTLLERQLVYTAVTRAKKLLIVVGSKRALNIASRRSSGSKRLSYLCERIRERLV